MHVLPLTLHFISILIMKTIPLRQWFLIFNPHWSQLGCYFKDVSFTQQRLWWVQAGAQECALQQWVILSVYDVEVWWSCCAVLSHSVVSNSLHPMDCQAARLLHPWGFFRQEYWSGFPFPSPGDLPNPGFAGRFFTSEPPGKPHILSDTLLIFSGIELLTLPM